MYISQGSLFMIKVSDRKEGNVIVAIYKYQRMHLSQGSLFMTKVSDRKEGNETGAIYK